VRVSVSRRIGCDMLGVGQTRLIELEKAGELISYFEGAERRILVSSIYALIIKRVLASHPEEGPVPTGRRVPPPRGRKSPRILTPAQSEALERANVRRHEDSEKRKNVGGAGPTTR